MRDGQNIGYYKDGSINYERWYKDNKLHRLDGPAYIVYYQDGSIYYEHWYKDDKYHRLDGPAHIDYYEDGSISNEEWYKDDKKLTIIPKSMLVAYMKSNDILLIELLTSNDELLRKSAESYKWEEVA